MRPRHDGRHCSDLIFRLIFLNENYCILILISLKYVPKDPIKNKPALIMVSRQATSHNLNNWCFFYSISFWLVSFIWGYTPQYVEFVCQRSSKRLWTAWMTRSRCLYLGPHHVCNVIMIKPKRLFPDCYPKLLHLGGVCREQLSHRGNTSYISYSYIPCTYKSNPGNRWKLDFHHRRTKM